MANDAPAPLKLNLGSGQRPMPGFVNVDKFGEPDVRWDLEQFPWPWATSSVGEVVLSHVLEHLGATAETHFGIMKELYRVCCDGALVRIAVPHPRHDDFLGDPTHVRAFTAQTFELYSKASCEKWAREQAANSPLALYLDVDFEIDKLRLHLDEPWHSRFTRGELPIDELNDAVRRYNNVVKELRVVLRVKKP